MSDDHLSNLLLLTCAACSCSPMKLALAHLGNVLLILLLQVQPEPVAPGALLRPMPIAVVGLSLVPLSVMSVRAFPRGLDSLSSGLNWAARSLRSSEIRLQTGRYCTQVTSTELIS